MFRNRKFKVVALILLLILVCWSWITILISLLETTEEPYNDAPIRPEKPLSKHQSVAVDWGEVIGNLLGGLSLFMYGSKLLNGTLNELAGERMRQVLSAISSNQFIGLITGILVTALLQSSALVTLMLVGFVSSGFMTLQQSISILLGSGIGTTLTSQLVAFNIGKYSLFIVAIGVTLIFSSSSPPSSPSEPLSPSSPRTLSTPSLHIIKIQQRKRIQLLSGNGFLGLGLIFFGISLMSRSMSPLRDYQPFRDFLVGLADWPVAAGSLAAVITALIQSSSAVVGIIIVLGSEGLVPLRAGIVFVLGSNVGTALSGIWAAVGAAGNGPDAARVAAANVFLKILGVVILLPVLGIFEGVVRASSGDLPRQIANAHTMYNVVVAFLFFPFTKQVAGLVTKVWKDHRKKNYDKILSL